MAKGFSRGSRGGVAGALLLAGLAWASCNAVAARAARPEGAGWWEVRLTIEAEGEYTINGGRAPLAGEFVCRASWTGRLEPDGEDFILIRLGTEVLEWRLREKAGRGGVLEAPSAAEPDLRLNYVLNDGREIEFFFELGRVSIPLHASPVPMALDLPRSSGRAAGRPGQAYGDFVRRGSSRVAIPETDLLQGSAERSFSWDWRRERRFDRGGRIFLAAQGHSAKVTVAVTAH
ncbi:MAG: hypothetical protein JW775_10815 [Candidatus Aminicenantes bacterium]|nr:hypothetical protein [Candidatus Aminicenantes bacterium]